MLRPRVIPCLLVRNGGLVKTVRFGAGKYVGDPINAVRIFNEKETDEIIVLDIDASVLGHEPNLSMVANLAAECRMPLCYGGGVRTVEQAKRIVALGVEKVALSSAAIDDPLLIERIAAEVGSQSVVVVLDVKRETARKDYEVFTHNGARKTGRRAVEWAREAQARGAGEILVNSIDDDGVMKGYDLVLARAIRDATSIPMTFLGGAGSLADIAKLFETCGVVGAAAGSLFVFKGPYKAVLINYPRPDQKDELARLLREPVGASAHV
jgi:imidazole glycerol-phosphate synthase subunit HisF